ncbi:MAG: SIS domain-containing protein [Campylobacterota bacterium]|nr:SIS domain-containing protein [Campylobacterota bacterium]
MEINNFITEYTNNLKLLLDNIDKKGIEKIIFALEKTKINKSKIYILGNGGSAATASHMVNDLGVGLRRRDISNFDIISLADNTPVCTAISNDIGYNNIFYMQLKGLLKKEDLIIAISCSGNSKNILKAVEYGNTIGSTIIGLTGFDGGKLKKESDISFHINTKKGEYGLVEDLHMILDHIIYSYYIQKGLQ